jgi:uncharacterized Tic20 family protein
MSHPLPPAAPVKPLTPAEDKQWAAFAHFGGILWFVPALVIYLVFRDRGSLTRQESKEALNWQITYTIAAVLLGIGVTVAASILSILGAHLLGDLVGGLPWVLYLANVLFSILGGVKVNAGGAYRYPFAFRLVK